jgi:hypothetical protein
MTGGPEYDFSGQTALVTGGARQVWIWYIDPVELDGAHS